MMKKAAAFLLAIFLVFATLAVPAEPAPVPEQPEGGGEKRVGISRLRVPGRPEGRRRIRARQPEIRRIADGGREGSLPEPGGCIPDVHREKRDREAVLVRAARGEFALGIGEVGGLIEPTVLLVGGE